MAVPVPSKCAICGGTYYSEERHMKSMLHLMVVDPEQARLRRNAYHRAYAKTDVGKEKTKAAHARWYEKSKDAYLARQRARRAEVKALALARAASLTDSDPAGSATP